MMSARRGPVSVPLGIVDVEITLIWAYREQGAARKPGPWTGENWEFVAAAFSARHSIPSGWISIERLASLGVRIDSGGGPALISTSIDDGPHADALETRQGSRALSSTLARRRRGPRGSF